MYGVALGMSATRRDFVNASASATEALARSRTFRSPSTSPPPMPRENVPRGGNTSKYFVLMPPKVRLLWLGSMFLGESYWLASTLRVPTS